MLRFELRLCLSMSRLRRLKHPNAVNVGNIEARACFRKGEIRILDAREHRAYNRL